MTISHAEGSHGHAETPHWPSSALAELYAHALTASTQAAEACGELSEAFDARGEQAAAQLFRHLAQAEAEIAADVIRRVAGRPLPRWPSWRDYSWFYQESPNHAARKLIARLMTGPAALKIALDVGSRAKGLYEQLSATAEHADVRAQAQRLSEEKSQHLRQVAGALGRSANRIEDDALLFAMP